MPDTPHAIITDIEGTTSSIDFVKDVLFPYAREHLRGFIEAHAGNAEVNRWLDETAHAADIDRGDRDAIIATLLGWIDADRKATPLKALQGMIWAGGYYSGAYRAHVYPEVPARLRDWHRRGIRLCVYSSASVQGQRLFFGHSEAGDLTPLISGWFDTEAGSKREAHSYARIAASLEEESAQCLFLSDVVAELDAAADVGMRTTWICRPPATCPDSSRHPCASDFDHVAV